MSEESQGQLSIIEQGEWNQPVSLKNHIDTLGEHKADHTLRQLAQALQTTRDTSNLLKTYSDQVQATVPHNSISFENPLMSIDLTFGTAAKHSCSYTLSFSQESMGRLTFTREKPFTDTELHTLENSLSVLFYPLGQAIYS